MIIKPMLATKADLDKIRYPVLATPKLDGIRCLMVNGTAMSRNMKPIPNQFVQQQLKGLHGLDGELMVADGDFNSVQSGIMKSTGEPDFKYVVFDTFVVVQSMPYFDRVKKLMEEFTWDDFPRLQLLTPKNIVDQYQLTTYLEDCIFDDYEGIMIRDPKGPYKHGRSTVNEGYLLKIKPFLDDEATLVELIEKFTNMNELTKDELGRAKRSSHNENMIPADTLGAVMISWKDKTFRCGFGPGITDVIKQNWWDERDTLLGKKITFRFQELSVKGIPRFPKMIGFRHPDDI